MKLTDVQIAELHRLAAEMDKNFDAADAAGVQLDNCLNYPLLDAEAAIMDPLFSNIDQVTNDEIGDLIAVLPAGFYRSELRVLLNKRLDQENTKI